MKSWKLAFAASAASLTCATPVLAAEVQIVAQNPTIELSVSEQIKSPPDMATFSTGVQTKAPTATQALRDNSAKIKTLINKIKSMGIAGKLLGRIFRLQAST